MPLPDNLIAALPHEVLNELAILEDRALRAESQLATRTAHLTELELEIGKLRGEVGLLLQLATETQEFAQEIAEGAKVEAGRVEAQLRKFLVVQAG
jgi:hypothetical protein